MKKGCGCETRKGTFRKQFDLECEFAYDFERHCGAVFHDEGYGGVSAEVHLKRIWINEHPVELKDIQDYLEEEVKDHEMP
jgi:hypothetical protein